MEKCSHALSAVLLSVVMAPLVFAQISWQRFPTPVFPVWAGNYNDPSIFRNTYDPFVLFDSTANLYRMWFSYQVYGSGAWCIGHAISPDGINWFGYSRNPVMEPGTPGAFDAMGLFTPFVVKVGQQLRMYYCGYNGSVWQSGVAFSTDGIQWQKYSGNPILTVVPGTWESMATNDPKVFHDGTQFIMFYNGHRSLSQCEVGLATSSDGLVWQRSPLNPVLRRGPSGSWDQNSVRACAGFVSNGRYFLLYDGGAATAIGFAHSVDGIQWTKYSANPVFSPGSPGTWDESRVEFGSVVRQGSLLKFWYSGYGPYGWQIGYATSALVTTVPGTVPLPSEYRLADAYPNPFNPSTTIEYEVPAVARVQIIIFDALGQRVATLVDEVQQPGYHKVQWSPKEQASGVYFYQMNAPAFSETKKLVLLK
jgi:predicted GH43/DUF377 family glycosyl hydrolase